MRFILVPFILISIFPVALHAQGETAVPFLLISPSPSANGMGNINTAIVSSDPTTTIINPAQLGMFGLNNFLAVSTFSNKTALLPRFEISDLTYDVWAINAGYNLRELLDAPFPIGIGFGYSKINLNLGTFIRTNPSGLIIGKFRAAEQANQFSVAFGAEYFVRVGLGWNFKRVVSDLGSTSTGGFGRAEPKANDFGLLLQAPVMDILKKAGVDNISLAPGIEPVADLTFGYTRNNVSSRPVTYANLTESDPMPRSTTIGISTEIGVKMRTESTDLRLLTFTLARGAEDLLVFRNQDGTFGYQSGLGDISFFKHVIGGRLSDNERPNIHKGWQLNFSEIVYLRGGSFTESPNFGARNFSTSGFGLRLGGLLKLIGAIIPVLSDEPVFSFIAHHVDFGYDHAEYNNHEVLGGTTFNSITFVVR
ncbi:MAG: hypothetical protein KF749_15380 [Bacteroidetes bacterium]|nr:hypothetical protein [Bacteroidota bacterium]MCW5893970.1 hypothetical protein [Bacteroidota bacterium]